MTTSSERRYNKLIKTKFISSCHDLNIGTEVIYKPKLGLAITLEDKYILLCERRLQLYTYPKDKSVYDTPFYQYRWRSLYLSNIKANNVTLILETEKTLENAEMIPYELRYFGII